MKRVWKLNAISIVVLGLMGVSFYAGIRKGHDKNYDLEVKSAEQVARHPLLAQRIFRDEDNNTIVNFEPLRRKLRTDLAAYGSGNASLYFEYLPTGTSIRIGDSTQLVGASLLKLPFVMDLYHLEEYKDFKMDDVVALKKEWLNDQYGDLYKKGEGYKISVRDLVKKALMESDNTAVLAIKSIVSGYNLPLSESSFSALDIDYSSTTTNDVSITARAYTSFIKCLYYSCYVSPDHSQEILQYLSQSVVETDRMTKYLPKELPVAHKVGTLADKTQNDCGIVYLEHRNYALCILLNDTDERGSEAIAKISKDVYDYLEKIDLKQ